MTISTPYAIPNLSTLLGLGSTERALYYSRLVFNPASGDSSNKQNPAWYIFDDTSTLDELGDIVLKPDDVTSGAGRWLRVSGPLVVKSTAVPSGVPPFIGVEWIAELTSPTRIVTWRSLATSDVTDWTPYGNELVMVTGLSTPGFTPDYIGQKAYCLDNNTMFVAEGVSSSSDFVATTGGGGGGGS